MIVVVLSTIRRFERVCCKRCDRHWLVQVHLRGVAAFITAEQLSAHSRRVSKSCRCTSCRYAPRNAPTSMSFSMSATTCSDRNVCTARWSPDGILAADTSKVNKLVLLMLTLASKGEVCGEQVHKLMLSGAATGFVMADEYGCPESESGRRCRLSAHNKMQFIIDTHSNLLSDSV